MSAAARASDVADTTVLLRLTVLSFCTASAAMAWHCGHGGLRLVGMGIEMNRPWEQCPEPMTSPSLLCGDHINRAVGE